MTRHKEPKKRKRKEKSEEWAHIMTQRSDNGTLESPPEAGNRKFVYPASCNRDWTQAEDNHLRQLIQILGVKTVENKNWTIIARCVGGRTAHQCRHRWVNYLREDLQVPRARKQYDQRAAIAERSTKRACKKIITYRQSEDDDDDDEEYD